MNKSEFEKAVRQELRRVSVDTRRTWDETDLFGWWMRTTSSHPQITWDRCRGDPWQTVKGICNDLIGDRAM